MYPLVFVLCQQNKLEVLSKSIPPIIFCLVLPKYDSRGERIWSGKRRSSPREAYKGTSRGENGGRIKNFNKNEENRRFSTLIPFKYKET